MVDFAKIIDHPSLVRDMRTNAVLNTDHVAVRRHEKRIADLQREQARENELVSLKSEMSEMRALLMQLSNNTLKTC
jgi:hypothetical protein